MTRIEGKNARKISKAYSMGAGSGDNAVGLDFKRDKPVEYFADRAFDRPDNRGTGRDWERNSGSAYED
jgi:hypothetical protein